MTKTITRTKLHEDIADESYKDLTDEMMAFGLLRQILGATFALCLV